MGAGNGEHKERVAFATRVYVEHGEFLRRVIRAQMQDDSLADDIFQGFFLSLITRPLPRQIDNLRSYLSRAVTRDIIDAKRRRCQDRLNVQNYARHKEDVSAEAEGPVQEVMAAEEMEGIVELIREHLRPTEARAVTLRLWDNCDAVEAARRMGVTVRSATRYLSLGLSKLRRAQAT
jgi:RNA polymerase sigma factor (sigma-70 family)